MKKPKMMKSMGKESKGGKGMTAGPAVQLKGIAKKGK
jgi:hypothetical protein